MITSKENILKTFGTFVKERRQALKLSQEDFGELCGLDRTYISGVERGLRNLSLTAIVSISSSLQITSAELVQGLENKAQQYDEEN
jgi:transcriptional regulator with XRE-family HTH domain